MTPSQVISKTELGELEPIYLVLGEERYLQAKVLEALRKAVLGAKDLGLNEDQLNAAETDVDRTLAAARTLPMMAPRRLVVVRAVERWEARGEGKTSGGASALDKLAAYAENPSTTTTLVLVATALDGRRKLVASAKSKGFLVSCDAPARSALPQWIEEAAARRDKRLAAGVADLLAELLGPELSPLDDALERLSLFVGTAEEISEEAVAECVVQVKPSTVWELVGAVGRRDLGKALSSLDRVYDPHDRGLRLLGVLTWSIRQLIRFGAGIQEGLSPPEAAKKAGAPPFKAQELEKQRRQTSPEQLEGTLRTLSEVDLALKGGSRRPPLAILEAAIISLCTAR